MAKKMKISDLRYHWEHSFVNNEYYCPEFHSIPLGSLCTSDLQKMNQDERVKLTGEVFTPPALVNDMLNKLQEYNTNSWSATTTYCDPACGDGAFLVEVLKRKLDNKVDPLIALQSIYGVDIIEENVRKCRQNLLKVLKKPTKEQIKAVLLNIVWIDPSKNPGGSLEFNFKFELGEKLFDRWDIDKDVDKWYNDLESNKLPVKKVGQKGFIIDKDFGDNLKEPELE